MVIVYRTLSHAGPDSGLRRMLLHLLWLLKVIEQRLKLKQTVLFLLMFSTKLLVFLLVLILFPWLCFLFLVLLLVRFCFRAYLRHFYPDWRFVNVSTLRCALDTFRCPGMITIFVTLDGNMDLAELQNHVTSFIQNHPAISSILKGCLVSRLGYYMWKESPDFDVANHVVVSRGFRRNKSYTDADLQDHISTLCSRALANNIPPWEVVMVPLSKCGGAGGCGILFRMHHLIAEQLPMKTVLLPTSMNLWNGDGKVPVLGANSATHKVFSVVSEAFRSRWQYVKDKCNPCSEGEPEESIICWLVIRSCVGFVHRILVESHKLSDMAEIHAMGKNAFSRIVCIFYLFPVTLKKFELHMAGTIYFGIRRALAFLLLLPFFTLLFAWQLFRATFVQLRHLIACVHHQMYKDTDSKELLIMSVKEMFSAMIAAFIAPGVGLHELTKFVEPVPLLQWKAWSGHRVYAWTPMASGQLIRNICEATNATPSEVLLTCCTGILRHYFRSLGSEVPENVSVTIPLCTNPTLDIQQDQGFTIIALPTGEADPILRLGAIQQRMQEIRGNPQRFVLSIYLVRYAATFLPQPIMTMVLNFFSHKYPVTITDVFISDSMPVSFGKNAIQTLNYWRPAQGNIGISLTLIHYSNGVNLAIASDREALPTPSVITSQLTKELHDMAMMLGLRMEKEFPRSPFSTASPASPPIKTGEPIY